MGQTITRIPALDSPIVPDVLRTSSYDVSSTSGNVLHEIPGRPDPEVSLRPAGTRAGTMTFTFTDIVAAHTAAAVHRQVGIFTLADTDVPQMGVTYVVTGTVRIYLDPETLEHWHLEVGFREVLP